MDAPPSSPTGITDTPVLEVVPEADPAVVASVEEEQEKEETVVAGVPKRQEFAMNWIDTIYLARAIQNAQTENKMCPQPFVFQMSLMDNFSAKDASIPPINSFFLYDSNKERKLTDPGAENKDNEPKILFHTFFPTAESFRDVALDTHEFFYEHIIEPLYQSLFAQGRIKGEYPDANNYRAALIEAVEKQRKENEPIQFQVLEAHGAEPRKLMFITDEEVILFPLIQTDQATPYGCLFIASTPHLLYQPLTTFQRFSLPSRLLL